MWVGSKVFYLSAEYIPYSGKFPMVQFSRMGDLPTICSLIFVDVYGLPIMCLYKVNVLMLRV